ncbi:Non-structural maintenance of chromosomes element 1 [Hibiscus syriacus]|uniref:Non-structural maintenance of chromosomes element 1 homolog n=1 Tax=Hibiscus syriacus TaxID=106335 RepID=A0A6A2YC52_HIBSY|nr:Non-structural maintenance of chromosomes element 1 [Hibiscus syriacus]
MALLSWKHHTLIQSLLERGPLTEEEFHSIFTAITDQNPAIAQDVTAEGCICNMDVLNIKLESQDSSLGIPAAFRNFTMSQKEKTLDQLVKDKWLCYTEDDNIGIGIRSILDLRGWFNNAGVPSCEVCNEAGLKGVVVCPSCGTQWQYKPPKAEPIEHKEEETEPMPSQPSSRPSQSQSSLRSKRKRQRLSQKDDENTVGCSSQADTKRVTRSSAHPRQCPPNMVPYLITKLSFSVVSDVST